MQIWCSLLSFPGGRCITDTFLLPWHRQPAPSVVPDGGGDDGGGDDGGGDDGGGDDGGGDVVVVVVGGGVGLQAAAA